MSMSLAVKEYASSVGGRAQLAVEAFATALEVIPSTLAENCGLSPIDTLLKLRVAHSEGHNNAYVDVYTGEIETSNAVVEPKRVVKTAVQSATDTACMILRIDNIVTAKEPDEFGM
jgi:chaperonin GroEL (HSP60 family)